MTPPRAPRRVSWAIAGRLLRGVAVAFMLVGLVALVAWPVRTDSFYVRPRHLGQLLAEGQWVNPAGERVFDPDDDAEDGECWLMPIYYRRDASLSFLAELLGM